MTPSPLNPSQHVERIREILIGRDLQLMHGRILRIEEAIENELPSESDPSLKEAMIRLQSDYIATRQELRSLKKQIDSPQNPSSQLNPAPGDSDKLASQITAQVDARFREILSHLQSELLQFKGQLNDDLRSLKSAKADRSEISKRFARLASAAMTEQDKDDTKQTEGFLL